MKWCLFTGTWRLTNSEVEEDVRAAVREVLSRGDGIVTGGATGVDHFAIDELSKFDPNFTRLRIFIPTSLSEYMHDYRTNWLHDPITDHDIDQLEKLLFEVKIKNPAALVELSHTNITQVEYNLRHLDEVKYSDMVYAFQVNKSTGTQDTIDKAKAAGLPIVLHKQYSISE
ncbi:MAG: hypothetical protein A2845_03770 [Candidatus Lloydbacteria bacterium RIFCSPHIGHO2_01_FULL_49_22]|uniref:Uncharacterized protein n=1 Tax=Candidatus Lloydbacteria bacterium RIFCSPHIGHO2_01_FULL_49_22 TaxID=1798658 RepID=A0A1G2CX00_9BACT|nr:MAG: hypothetical protein A2845_03770 [Candidatus Lloydbacteria bacterium RIFCSPHIGHO2_01_FULL_49_22]OGZ09046.1 MAG: hypothetical protein A3C14_03605 [Candidatus Lloydbacteria bacterium RIFCSPHIGHO2_02_FULL_50_18]